MTKWEIYLNKISSWTGDAARRLGIGDEVIDYQPMRAIEALAPENKDRLIYDSVQEEAITRNMESSGDITLIANSKIKHDELNFNRELIEIMAIEEQMRYGCSRRHSIMTAANNLDRIARDTQTEFERL